MLNVWSSHMQGELLCTRVDRQLQTLNPYRVHLKLD